MPQRMLSKGSMGKDVRQFQGGLNADAKLTPKGPLNALNPLVVDGQFGPNTHAKLMEFQRRMMITADGIAGPQTFKTLFDDFEKPIAFTPPSNSPSMPAQMPNLFRPPAGALPGLRVTGIAPRPAPPAPPPPPSPVQTSIGDCANAAAIAAILVLQAAKRQPGWNNSQLGTAPLFVSAGGYIVMVMPDGTIINPQGQAVAF